MNIVFLIATVGHGKGGHFNSLHTMANELGKLHSVVVLNLGYQKSEVLVSENYKVNFVKYNGYNFLKAYKVASKICKEISPKIIHAFDVESFAFSRLLAKRYKLSSYLTKCGGPNPKKYYPIPNNLVLFSQENLKFFKDSKRYSSSNITIIPNRVETIQLDKERIELFKKKYNDDSYKILRISRIGKHYYKSILQGINLLEWLLHRGKNVKFILVGTIQSEEIYQKIVKYIEEKKLSKYVIIDTSDVFTKRASGILGVGDMILGTGRNFMEACSLNKTMLVPYKETNFPVLVTEQNFQSIFATNFSPRTVVPNFNENDNLESILELVNSNADFQTKNWFTNYFDVSVGAQKYLELYIKLNDNKSFVLDTVINILYSIRTFVIS